jgi:hypothetical protein
MPASHSSEASSLLTWQLSNSASWQACRRRLYISRSRSSVIMLHKHRPDLPYACTKAQQHRRINATHCPRAC